MIKTKGKEIWKRMSTIAVILSLITVTASAENNQKEAFRVEKLPVYYIGDPETIEGIHDLAFLKTLQKAFYIPHNFWYCINEFRR